MWNAVQINDQKQLLRSYYCDVQANIHSIMASEDQVLELMVQLDKGIQEAVRIEEKLDEYEQKLQVCLSAESVKIPLKTS